MNCNLDILIAGCSTNCMHCYVDGGPAQMMKLSDIDYAMKRLHRLLPKVKELGIEMEVTLDNEPINHPDALEVYQLTHKYLGNYYFHHGSTSGIPILNHANRNEILRILKEYKYEYVSLTLHGGEENHNKIVRNSGGMNAIKDAAQLYTDYGFKVGLSLMLNKHLVEDREEVSEIIKNTPHEFIYFAIPNCSPVKRMREYQKIRVTLNEAKKIESYLTSWGCDKNKLKDQFDSLHHDALIEKLQTLKSWDDVKKSSDTIYLTLDSNLSLHYGNTGVTTANWGNLRDLEDESIINRLITSNANELFWDSCFDKTKLPNFKEFVFEVMRGKKENHIYQSMDSFITYWLMTMGSE